MAGEFLARRSALQTGVRVAEDSAECADVDVAPTDIAEGRYDECKEYVMHCRVLKRPEGREAFAILVAHAGAAWSQGSGRIISHLACLEVLEGLPHILQYRGRHHLEVVEVNGLTGLGGTVASIDDGRGEISVIQREQIPSVLILLEYNAQCVRRLGAVGQG